METYRNRNTNNKYGIYIYESLEIFKNYKANCEKLVQIIFHICGDYTNSSLQITLKCERKNTVYLNGHHKFTLLPHTYSSVCINLFDEKYINNNKTR